MNRRSLFAVPPALLAASAVASEGVFAWVDRLLAKRSVQLLPSAPCEDILWGSDTSGTGEMEEITVGDPYTYRSIGGPIAAPKDIDLGQLQSDLKYDISGTDRHGTKFRLWSDGERLMISRRRA